MLESDFIGAVPQTSEYAAALQRIRRPDGYVPYQPAVDLVKRFQPWDPAHPRKDFSRDLRLELIDLLGLPPESYDRVKVYTAVGTPLDHLHGVDGFVDIEDPESGTLRRITFDISMRDKGEGGHKADFLIPELPDPQHESAQYLGAIAQHGKAFFARLPSVRVEPIPRSSPPQAQAA